MSRDQRQNYNGLHLPGGIQTPIGAQMTPEERQQQAFNQQHQALAREIYVRVAAELIAGADMEADCACPLDDEFVDLSHWCQKAATGYFGGLKYHLEKLQRADTEVPAAE